MQLENNEITLRDYDIEEGSTILLYLNNEPMDFFVNRSIDIEKTYGFRVAPNTAVHSLKIGSKTYSMVPWINILWSFVGRNWKMNVHVGATKSRKVAPLLWTMDRCVVMVRFLYPIENVKKLNLSSNQILLIAAFRLRSKTTKVYVAVNNVYYLMGSRLLMGSMKTSIPSGITKSRKPVH